MRGNRGLVIAVGVGLGVTMLAVLLVLVPAELRGTADGVVRVAGVALGVVLVVIGLLRIATPAVRVRGDFRSAIATALVVGAVAALAVDFFVAGLNAFGSGVRPEHFVEAAPFAALAGGAAAVATLAAYGLVSRLVSDGRGAPAAAVGLVLLTMVAADMGRAAVAAGRSQLELMTDPRLQEAVAEWERQLALGVWVEVVDVVVAPQPDGSDGVVALTLALTFAPSTDATLTPAAPDAPWRVSASYMYMDHDPQTVVSLFTDITGGTPSTLRAGDRAEVEIRLSTGGGSNDAPVPGRPIQAGPWNLDVDVVLDGSPVQIGLAFSVPDTTP